MAEAVMLCLRIKSEKKSEDMGGAAELLVPREWPEREGEWAGVPQRPPGPQSWEGSFQVVAWWRVWPSSWCLELERT